MYFAGLKMTMSQEVQLIVSNLMSKIRPLAHPMCDRYACLEAWLLARLECSVVRAKFDIFRHSDKYGECFDRML